MTSFLQALRTVFDLLLNQADVAALRAQEKGAYRCIPTAMIRRSIFKLCDAIDTALLRPVIYEILEMVTTQTQTQIPHD
jgi:hypothetical protein